MLDIAINEYCKDSESYLEVFRRGKKYFFEINFSLGTVDVINLYQSLSIILVTKAFFQNI